MTTITTTQPLPTERTTTRSGLWRSVATFAAGVALAAGAAAGINAVRDDSPAPAAPATVHAVATPGCAAHGPC